MIELVFHERRPYPPVPKKEPAEAPADQGVGGGAESADEARPISARQTGCSARMPYASSGDAKIYYEVHGTGPAVLFVHGSASRGPSQAVLVRQSIGAAAALRAALDRPDRAAGVILAHSLGGLRDPELTALVKADRARAEQLPVLDRLLTPEFRAERPDLAFLFRQMGTFNTAKMQDLRNLNTDGPTVSELAAAPFPVLLLAGEKDAVLSPATVRRAGELLPSARVEVVTGAPHSMYWETPALFNDAVARFLKDVAAAA
jgi:hypothetical protein